MNPNLEIQVQNLAPLGLVALVIDEIGIVEIITEIVPEKAAEHLIGVGIQPEHLNDDRS